MLPLPDPTDKASFLPEYPSGAEVMALYPDTTSFYHAHVKEPPHWNTKVSLKHRLALVAR